MFDIILLCYIWERGSMVNSVNNKEQKHWYDFPQKIKYWTSDIDYVMFVDENGNGGRIGNTLKKLINNETIDENNRYFTITGCIFKKEDYVCSKDEFQKLKKKYWKNGMYYDVKDQTDKYVCFHSREIRRHDNEFNDKIIDYSNFLIDLSKTLENTKCKIISVTIDLVLYLKKGYLQSVYEIAFDLLLERFIYVTKNGRKGIIMLEARGKAEDKKLLKHIYDVVYNKENIYTSKLESKIAGVYFNPKWNEEYSATYIGLEITDLFSYPIHQYIKYQKENPAFVVLKSKLDGYPEFINKGIKIFPDK